MGLFDFVGDIFSITKDIVLTPARLTIDALDSAGQSAAQVIAKKTITPNINKEGAARKRLEEDRRKQLQGEQIARDRASREAETRGRRFGAGGRSTFFSRLGFGSGNTSGGGRGSLFGN